MRQLRPDLDDERAFVARVIDQQQSGYRLAFVQEDEFALAVAGFRLLQNLAWGRFLYVDDLVTDGRFQCQGHGSLLFDWLVDLARHERAQGRRLIVFCRQTSTRDITARLKNLLQREGLKSIVLTSSVGTQAREEWLHKKLGEGIDVLITNPELVKTGLDLLEFPTIVFLQSGYNVYSLQQAARRSWRIGQKQPVRVVYFAYRATLQAQALLLVAHKLQASLIVEGEIGDGGLAAHGAEGDNLTLELARSLTGGGEVDEESLEALFAEARLVADAAQEALDARDVAPEAFSALVGASARPASQDGWTPVADRFGSDDGEQMRLL